MTQKRISLSQSFYQLYRVLSGVYYQSTGNWNWQSQSCILAYTTSILAIQTSTDTTKQWHKMESVRVRVSTCLAISTSACINAFIFLTSANCTLRWFSQSQSFYQLYRVLSGVYYQCTGNWNWQSQSCILPYTTSVLLAIETSTDTTKQWHKSKSVRVRVSTNCTAFFLAYSTSLLAIETSTNTAKQWHKSESVRVRVVY